jgi:PcfJ-like protein
MENLIAYATSLNASKDVIWWIENVGKKNIKANKTTISELEHIVDWMVSNDAPSRLMKMSLKVAKDCAEKWMSANTKKGKNIVDSDGDIDPFMEFDDKSKIVILKTNNAFKREGFLMGHCLGGYSVRDGFEIYSLRDDKNNPHATFEVNKNGKEILQIKGKGNGEIHPKYIHRVLSFLEKVGIKVRKEEMKNLGYYYVPSIHLQLVKNNIRKNEKLIEINNDFYVV